MFGATPNAPPSTQTCATETPARHYPPSPTAPGPPVLSPAADPLAWAPDEADYGLCHALTFTPAPYPQNIKIREKNREVVEEACLYCHKEFVSRIELGRPQGQGVSCLKCHNEVGHER